MVTPHAPMASRGFILLAIWSVLLTGCGGPGSESTTTSARPEVPTSTLAPSATARASQTDDACRDRPTGPTTVAYAELPAVDPDLTSVDVYLPAGCGPAPVVMWVHGGGWQRGDKANGTIEQKAAWAASFGAALVSVNYRLSTPGSGVMWPDHGEDVAAAVAWVQQRGSTVGLAGTSITLIGHSAGGHLVAIVATDPSLLTEAGADPANVSCVVALDASFDLADTPAQELITNAFGTDPEAISNASPTIAIERNGPPSARFQVVTRGSPRRVDGARAFVDLVNNSGGSAELVDATGYTHDEVNSRLGAPDDVLVTPAVTDFVRSCT